jgi:hypothetical protein
MIRIRLLLFLSTKQQQKTHPLRGVGHRVVVIDVALAICGLGPIAWQSASLLRTKRCGVLVDEEDPPVQLAIKLVARNISITNRLRTLGAGGGRAGGGLLTPTPT